MTRVFPAALLLGLLLFGASSANAGTGADQSTLNCAPGKLRMVQILFGMSSKDGKGVSEQEWENFLLAEVDPYFPGATVTDSLGRYLDKKNNKLYLERAKILTLITDCNIEYEKRMQEVIQKYMVKFGQDSVGKLDMPSVVVNFIENKNPGGKPFGN